MHTMQTRKNILLWVLYDFANSIVSIVFFLYFAQWVVIEEGVADFYFNLTFTVAALLLLFTVPVTGTMLDSFLSRIKGLRFATLCTVFFYSLCAVSALNGAAIMALIFFTLGLYAYLFSFTFYTPLINDIAAPERRGRVSGFGIGANYLGQFAGLLLALPFAQGSISFFGSSARVETLLPAVTVFLIFALPMLLFFEEAPRHSLRLSALAVAKKTFHESRGLFISSGVAIFFLSYFLFNDAILTAANNFPIFLEQVWRISDATKTYLLLGILVTSAMGGALAGFIADRFGHKRTLGWILSGWVLLLPLVGLIVDFSWFVVATVLMGFWFGATWAVSRSVMAYVAPHGRRNLAFAYFGLAERASSLVGPLAWGAIVSGLVSIGSDRYRIAILSLTAFLVVGAWIFRYVTDDRACIK